jgi:hypothetical protein
LKGEFLLGVAEVADVPPVPRDPIDDLICAVHECSAPISFADTPKRTLELIEENLYYGKKIILISSARLGKEIVPQIIEKNLKIESYYVFCQDILYNRDFGNECIENGLDIQMFDHQTTLLIRLGRDMSKLLINEGKVLLDENEPGRALEYFQYASQLAEKAVEHDIPVDDNDRHKPSVAHRSELALLIKKAKDAMN